MTPESIKIAKQVEGILRVSLASCKSNKHEKISFIRVGSFKAASLSSIPGLGEPCDYSSVCLLWAHGGLVSYLSSISLFLSIHALHVQRCWVCERRLTVPLPVTGTSHLANITKTKTPQESIW